MRLILFFNIVILCILFLSCKSQKELLQIQQYDREISLFRDNYTNSFINNPRLPLTEADLKNINFYKADIDYNVMCAFSESKNAVPFEMPTYSGITRTYILHGTAKCNIHKKTVTLELYRNLSQPGNPLTKNLLFLPFKDTTNDKETYGGGRYINLNVADIKNDSIQIDFNKAYNPYCAFSDGFNCPIPPVANRLDIPIKAGEKKYTGMFKNIE
ncbi:MAG: DUF1684 domain-containing protein [Saprospiraceae bacterium]|nr:DUF1684 domain-containing protein [Saprospiraceae bacterium]